MTRLDAADAFATYARSDDSNGSQRGAAATCSYKDGASPRKAVLLDPFARQHRNTMHASCLSYSHPFTSLYGEKSGKETYSALSTVYRPLFHDGEIQSDTSSLPKSALDQLEQLARQLQTVTKELDPSQSDAIMPDMMATHDKDKGGPPLADDHVDLQTSRALKAVLQHESPSIPAQWKIFTALMIDSPSGSENNTEGYRADQEDSPRIAPKMGRHERNSSITSLTSVVDPNKKYTSRPVSRESITMRKRSVTFVEPSDVVERVNRDSSGPSTFARRKVRSPPPCNPRRPRALTTPTGSPYMSGEWDGDTHADVSEPIPAALQAGPSGRRAEITSFLPFGDSSRQPVGRDWGFDKLSQDIEEMGSTMSPTEGMLARRVPLNKPIFKSQDPDINDLADFIFSAHTTLSDGGFPLPLAERPSGLDAPDSTSTIAPSEIVRRYVSGTTARSIVEHESNPITSALQETLELEDHWYIPEIPEEKRSLVTEWTKSTFEATVVQGANRVNSPASQRTSPNFNVLQQGEGPSQGEYALLSTTIVAGLSSPRLLTRFSCQLVPSVAMTNSSMSTAEEVDISTLTANRSRRNAQGKESMQHPKPIRPLRLSGFDKDQSYPSTSQPKMSPISRVFNSLPWKSSSHRQEDSAVLPKPSLSPSAWLSPSFSARIPGAGHARVCSGPAKMMAPSSSSAMRNTLPRSPKPQRRPVSSFFQRGGAPPTGSPLVNQFTKEDSVSDDATEQQGQVGLGLGLLLAEQLLPLQARSNTPLLPERMAQQSTEDCPTSNFYTSPSPLLIDLATPPLPSGEM